jgi:hypothetical protein
MKKFSRVCLTAVFMAVFMFAPLAVAGDSLKLRDGRSLSGQFVGATSSEVWFHADGEGEFSGTRAFPVGQVSSVVFDSAMKPSGLSSQTTGASRMFASLREWISKFSQRSQYFAFVRSQK